MIAGIGTDIASIERLRRLYARHGERAARRILAPAELEDCTRSSDPGRFLAKRFAAKEAFGKALGIGVAVPATMPNVAIVHDALGKPSFAFAPELAEHMAQRRLTAHLSISDEREMAVAFVVLERT